jgi:GTPase SAR1 family protein
MMNHEIHHCLHLASIHIYDDVCLKRVTNDVTRQRLSSGEIAVMSSLGPRAGHKASQPPSPTSSKWASGLQRITAELRQARKKLQALAAVSPPGVIGALGRIEDRLARPLRVAIVGEVNSGKSSLANLLIRGEALPTAIVSNTRIPTLLYHAPRRRVFAVQQDGLRKEVRNAGSISEASISRLEVGLPSARLNLLEILDLPGLADPRFDRGIGDLMLDATDVLLWCTVSTQAWKESERTTWDSLPIRLRRCALLLVTHYDLVHEAVDTPKLLRRLQKEAEGFSDIVPVATTTALALLKEKSDELGHAAWAATGVEAFEEALDRLLENVAARRIKIALGLARRVASRALSRL